MRGALVTAGAIAVAASVALFPALGQDANRETSARRELEANGIPYSAEGFLRRAASGDARALNRFLDAGMDIDATDRRGRTALQIASENEHWDAVEVLLKRGGSLLLALQGIAQSRESGDWIQSNIVPLGSFSPALIALVGLVFTYFYNQSQQRQANECYV